MPPRFVYGKKNIEFYIFLFKEEKKSHPQLIYFLPGSRFNQCFGVIGILDRLHGTDTKFRQTKQYERHAVLTGLTPLNDSIPDAPKKGQWWPLTFNFRPRQVCDQEMSNLKLDYYLFNSNDLNPENLLF